MRFSDLAKSGYTAFVQTGYSAFTLLDARLDAVRQYVSVEDVELIFETEELSAQVYEWKKSFDGIAVSLRSAIDLRLAQEAVSAKAEGDDGRVAEIDRLEKEKAALLGNRGLAAIDSIEREYLRDSLFLNFYTSKKDESLGAVGGLLFSLCGMKAKAAGFEAVVEASKSVRDEIAEIEKAISRHASMPRRKPDPEALRKAKAAVRDCWKEAVRLIGTSGAAVWEMDRQLALLLARVCSKMAEEKSADTIAVPFADEQDKLAHNVMAFLREFQAATGPILQDEVTA